MIPQKVLLRTTKQYSNNQNITTMRKNKTNPVRLLIKCGFLLCLFLTITPCQLHAQDIDFTAGCPNGAYTFSDVTIGSSISPALTINAVNTPGGAAATMSIQYVAFDNGLAEIPDCIIPPCSSPYAIYGVNITTSGGTVTVDGTPDNAAVGFTIIFTIRGDRHGLGGAAAVTWD